MQPRGAAGNPQEQLAAKQAIRGMVRAARAATAVDAGRRDVGDEARALVSVALPHLAGAATVALYASLPGEPDTGPIRAALAASGTRVLLPWVRDDLDLDWVLDPAGGPAAPGPSATRRELVRPPGSLLGVEAVTAAEVVVLPALAVDTAGRRLGQGGGSYDRVLARLRSAGRRPRLIACVRDSELFDAASQPLPEAPHDQRVDAVLTPTRWLPLPLPR